MYLDKINSPDDLKSLSVEELDCLAEEIRTSLLDRTHEVGGHIGSNLGIVEATIALHYDFNSPIDKIVFDVSHQCYTHKILTGRREAFTVPERYKDVSGFTNPKESKHDIFKVGHTSTGVSLALGLAKARDLRGDKENIIAVVGDGAICGGEAFEGLNNASMLNSNFIILFNDNEMSIANNYGGMYRHFRKLRETQGKCSNNFFKLMGFDYLYLEEGNNIGKLIELFESVKGHERPIVVHIHTQKGKGWPYAENNKEAGHNIKVGGYNPYCEVGQRQECYENLTREYLLDKLAKDSSIMVVNCATPASQGLTFEFRDKAGKQFLDVGIAEEHAVAYCSGIAKNGGKPVLVIQGTFMQRTYDQLMQDLGLNETAVTVLVFAGGLYPSETTHSGAFDISMVCNIPGLTCLAPTNVEEYFSMLDWAIEQEEGPVVIRVPMVVRHANSKESFSSEKAKKYELLRKGKDVAILGLGNFALLAEKVEKRLASEGIKATMVNPRFYAGIDKDFLESLKDEHRLVVTLEDGMLSGGFGEKIARFYGNSDMKVLNFGGDKEIYDRVPQDELYARCRLNVENIVSDIKAILLPVLKLVSNA